MYIKSHKKTAICSFETIREAGHNAEKCNLTTIFSHKAKKCNLTTIFRTLIQKVQRVMQLKIDC